MIQDYDKYRKRMGLKQETPPAVNVVLQFLTNLFVRLWGK
jgi:hypothetical protein